MSDKTLATMRTSVRALYGDIDGITASDTEVDLFLKDGINVVLNRCHWMYVPTPATVSLTTDLAGGAVFPTQQVGTPHLVEMQQTDTTTYVTLTPSHSGNLSLPNNLYANSANDITEYYLDGQRITFYPILRSTALVIRMTYASDSIGSLFPTVSGNALPNSIPVQAEEAAIIYAVMRLQQRDDNMPAVEMLRGDLESKIVMLTAQHNRPQRGTALTPFVTDVYFLDADGCAW